MGKDVPFIGLVQWTSYRGWSIQGLKTFAFVNQATNKTSNELHITSHSSIVYSITTQFKSKHYYFLLCNMKTRIWNRNMLVMSFYIHLQFVAHQAHSVSSELEGMCFLIVSLWFNNKDARKLCMYTKMNWKTQGSSSAVVQFNCSRLLNW